MAFVCGIEGLRGVAGRDNEGGRDFRSLLGPGLRGGEAAVGGTAVTGGADDGRGGMDSRTVRASPEAGLLFSFDFIDVLRLGLRKSFAWIGNITPSPFSPSLLNRGVKANACAKFQCSSAVSGSLAFACATWELGRWLELVVGWREALEELRE